MQDSRSALASPWPPHSRPPAPHLPSPHTHAVPVSPQTTLQWSTTSPSNQHPWQQQQLRLRRLAAVAAMVHAVMLLVPSRCCLLLRIMCVMLWQHCSGGRWSLCLPIRCMDWQQQQVCKGGGVAWEVSACHVYVCVCVGGGGGREEGAVAALQSGGGGRVGRWWLQLLIRYMG